MLAFLSTLEPGNRDRLTTMLVLNLTVHLNPFNLCVSLKTPQHDMPRCVSLKTPQHDIPRMRIQMPEGVLHLKVPTLAGGLGLGAWSFETAPSQNVELTL